MTAANQTYFTVHPVKKVDKQVELEITITYQYLSRKAENGMVCHFIPAFDLYFYSKSEDDKDVMSEACIKSFLRYWIERESWQSFLRHVRNLGFEPGGGPLDWKKLLKDKKIANDTTFKPYKAKNLVPMDFVGAEKREHKFEAAY